jgi:hypothetical protein
MNDYDPTSPSPAGEATVTTAEEARRPSVRRLLATKKSAAFVAAGLSCAVAGLAAVGTSSTAVAATPSATVTPTATPPTAPASGPEPGGSTGIVDTTSATGFTFVTATGVEVNATETSSTKYELGILPAPAKVVKKGESVLVLGIVQTPAMGTTDPAVITATQVTVQIGGDGGAAAAAKAGVVKAQQGTTPPAKSVGQIPSDYVEGEGTIITGSAAYKATTAAQAVVPGGVVDRVVQLSSGEYEVHYIGVNWPHHIFVDQNFTVAGAE